MNVKFLDIMCWKCNELIAINLEKDLVREFCCWQSVNCPHCGTYNDLRMRKVPFFKDEQPITTKVKPN